MLTALVKEAPTGAEVLETFYRRCLHSVPSTCAPVWGRPNSTSYSEVLGVPLEGVASLVKAIQRSRVARLRGSAQPRGRAADKISQRHVDEGLIPHAGKAFRDKPRATFWGTNVDGEAGLVRGSLIRAIPLMHVILRVVNTRVATVRWIDALWDVQQDSD
ncbi:hypothetical protein AK812_SmicGene26276 [Symbiodinium microadriaticum]|uniref:Uncharacterized protein n=1 Tax=Symbiodinium microadriaticum TaxID=2951 RepID=A0A1Q9D9Z3_SYMMI|nr:hypothetical protein AK812_SmicGene26276 [Symbiodinium microadriaticum]